MIPANDKFNLKPAPATLKMAVFPNPASAFLSDLHWPDDLPFRRIIDQNN